MDNHLLITGIPGTGKTTVGNYLREHFGFIHYDFEDENVLKLFGQDKNRFISRALTRKRVVITWGFMPYGHTEHVFEIKRRGFILIWFDGDRDAALREFSKRGTVSGEQFQIQLSNINSSGVLSMINPHIINTFDSRGRFRTLEEIAHDVMSIN